MALRHLLASATALGTALAMSGAWAQDETVDLVYATPNAVTTLEPTQVSGFSDHTATLAVFGTLMFNFDGQTGDVGYYPYLAESVEATSDTTWRITLREGQTFHNGEPLDAEAVKFSLDRIQHPDFPSGRYLSNAPIESVEVIDELTVDVHTSEPIAIMPARLLRADGYIVEPGHYADEPPFENISETAFDPVGAGPFRFVEHIPDDRLVLEVFEDFEDPRGYERPNYDRLILRVIPETSTLMAELLQGNVDIAPIPPEMVPVVENAENLRVVAGPDTTRATFIINQAAHPALADKRVRQAINYAIDVESLRQALTGGEGQRIATHANPPNNPDDLEPYPYDPDRARELLAEAGYEDGFQLDIDWSTPAEIGRIAEAIVPYLEEVGIQVGEVRELEWGSVYIPRQTEGTLAALHGHGHGGVEMTVETDLWTFHPDRATNSANWEGEAEDRFVELYDDLRNAVNPAEQEEIGHEIQRLIHEEAIAVTFWQMPRFMAVSDRVGHFIPYPGSHNEDFWTIRMAE
ncbi:ABC transporter substrate-binding protein [Pelagibacterium montanilacus]|uniref:ABC transporter substrate-binding protein n=1 Tax=Pelagibacterium montanilacus TaxID=2185280 RepID=UPI000F8DB405|nr:ABC transporter substrate-binding protein [Pelagibacterium montanilacus]